MAQHNKTDKDDIKPPAIKGKKFLVGNANEVHDHVDLHMLRQDY